MENKSKDKETKRSKKGKPVKGGDHDEGGCRKRAQGVWQFGSRYHPSDPVQCSRFDAIKDIYQSRIGHLLSRQSAFQDKGWDSGGGTYRTTSKKHQNINRVTIVNNSFVYDSLYTFFQVWKDPFFKKCMVAFRATTSKIETYKDCCKVVEREVDPFLAQENVRNFPL